MAFPNINKECVFWEIASFKLHYKRKTNKPSLPLLLKNGYSWFIVFE